MMNQQVTASLSIAALLCLGAVPDVTGSDFSYAEVDVGAFDFDEISLSSSEAAGPVSLFEPPGDDLDQVSYESFARLAARSSRYELIEDLPESWKIARPRFDGAYLRDSVEEEEGGS